MGRLIGLLVGLPAVLSQCSGICESFDTYNGSLLNGKTYGPYNLSSSVSTSTTSPIWAEVDTNFYYSAPSSLHINCTASNSTQALLTASPPTPLAWPNVYGRTMLYYSNASGNAVPNSVHSWIFNAAGSNSYFNSTLAPNTTTPNGVVSMNLIVKDYVCLNYHWGPSEMSVCSSAKVIQANQWTCIQWHYDGPNSNAEVWVNGTQVISVVHHESTNYTPVNSSQWRFADSPGWKTLQFGFQHYQTLTSPVDLHMDDVVLDTKPTCCPCAAGVTLPYCCTSAPTVAPGSPTSAPTTPSSYNETDTTSGAVPSRAVGSAVALLLLLSVF